MDKTPAQQLKGVVSNPNWKNMEDYLAAERDRLVSQLCKCSLEDLKDLQGQVKVIDRLLALRKNILAEEGRH